MTTHATQDRRGISLDRLGGAGWAWLAVLALLWLGAVAWLRASEPAGVGRWLVWAVAGLAATALVLSAVGALYQAWGQRRDYRRFPPPGEVVAAGGRRFHLQVAGEGGPTVVFESMMGETMLGWAEVQERVARETRTVSYDRAGFGWSEWTGTPRTGERIARELHDLLEAAGIAPPYVLVGHVFGALTARTFARLYPAEVAGLVLVDPLHEDKPARMPEQHEAFDRQAILQARVLRALAPLGLLRLLVRSGKLSQVEARLDRFPAHLRDPARAVFLRTGYWRALYREFTEWKIGTDRLRAEPPPRDLPLVVITPGVWNEADFPEGFPVEETRRVWTELHGELAASSARGRHRMAEDSDDMVQWGDPDLVVDTVLEVLEEARREWTDFGASLASRPAAG